MSGVTCEPLDKTFERFIVAPCLIGGEGAGVGEVDVEGHVDAPAAESCLAFVRPGVEVAAEEVAEGVGELECGRVGLLEPSPSVQ